MMLDEHNKRTLLCGLPAVELKKYVIYCFLQILYLYINPLYFPCFLFLQERKGETCQLPDSEAVLSEIDNTIR